MDKNAFSSNRGGQIFVGSNFKKLNLAAYVHTEQTA